MHAPNLESEKSALRARMLSRRLAMPATTQAIAAKAVARHYADHPILAFMPSLAVYAPMRTEVDMAPLVSLMRGFRKTIALPRIVTESKTLSFHTVDEHAALTRHTLGHDEPTADTPLLAAPAVILCPLLAFDNRGNRLGYGGGYYDRTIHALRQAFADKAPLLIGVAYGLQEVQEVPANADDAMLDGILTEQGISMFNEGL